MGGCVGGCVGRQAREKAGEQVGGQAGEGPGKLSLDAAAFDDCVLCCEAIKSPR